MIRSIANIFLGVRFFLILGSIAALFLLSFIFPWLFLIAKAVLFGSMVLFVVDLILLHLPGTALSVSRDVDAILSLGDPNPVYISLNNNNRLQKHIRVFDELPIQLQERDFDMHLKLTAQESRVLNYEVTPKIRGAFDFGDIRLYIKSPLGIVIRRQIVKSEFKVKVYPSIIQMRQFELHALTRISIYSGVKKLRRLGHSYEFEQIKNYVKGDDYRSINWKATGRRSELMVNQYEDERSQPIYSVIDKSRNMRMPFDGLSLLDYAINSSLVISNVALQKSDKAGLITFSDKVGSTIKAESGQHQLRKIYKALYNEQERKVDSSYEVLYYTMRNIVRSRSLIFLYTNFESHFALERMLPVLRKINRTHLLVVVFFENTEVTKFLDSSARNVEEIYQQTIARKFIYDKKQMAREMLRYGIQVILTSPEDLNINTVNKYLELKSRGLI